MRSLDNARRNLSRTTTYALLALFAVPLLVFLFNMHVQKTWDQEFSDYWPRVIATLPAKNPARKAELLHLFSTYPPSQACLSNDPHYESYRALVCKSGTYGWQFRLVAQLTRITLVFGLFMLLAMAALGALAWRGRAGQYRSLVLGWPLLAWGSALMILVQSAMLVWLAFWVTAFFFDLYLYYLIVVVGLLAGAAAILAVARIVAPVPSGMALPGEQVQEDDAPALWSRIRLLASQAGSAPPDHLIAGIDANFFVAEGDVTVQGRVLAGRSLYVSLPLLRILDAREADALLVHELAHQAANDASGGAGLGPKLVQFNAYSQAMRSWGLTWVPYCLTRWYRAMFELARMHDCRERELVADRTAASCVAALPLVYAMIKVAAYSCYRGCIDRELFERNERDRAGGLAACVLQGLQPFARSPRLLVALGEARVPHPFDTHPRLLERMDHLDCRIPQRLFGTIASETVERCWCSEIVNCEAIEQRLWAGYEAELVTVHEHKLAHRYLPSTDAERELVLKHFPDLVFTLDEGLALGVRYEGLALPKDRTLLGWSAVARIDYEQGVGSDVLKLTLADMGWLGARSTKVRLPGVKCQREALRAALDRYWNRHRAALGQT